MPPLIEAGKPLNKANKSKLKAAWEAIKAVLDSTPDEDAASEDQDTKEASTWSLNDKATSLTKALGKYQRNAYLSDIFPDENVVAYQVGWPGVYYQIGYSIDDTGVATLDNNPIEVNRKATYVPVSSNTAIPNVSMESIDLATSEAQIIPLVEKSVADDNTVMLKLISPGWGSSGYYSEDVLKRDGPKVFTKGLHNLIDHPTAQEESARPEGSIEKLGSTLIEDAKWLDDYKGNGSGLYAKAQVVPTFKETLDAIANNIGTSIRAKGKAKVGEINGKKGAIIESIDRAMSVDYVTLPGRGGKVIELMESARSIPMTIDEVEFKRLQESNRLLSDQVMRLNEARMRDSASKLLESGLQSYTTLSKATKARIRNTLSVADLPLTESGELDAAKYREVLTTAVSNEVAYLASLGLGHVKDVGSTGTQPADDMTYEKFAESLKELDD